MQSALGWVLRVAGWLPWCRAWLVTAARASGTSVGMPTHGCLLTPALLNPQLMCHMYAKVGVELLGLLRGSFSFVLYESKTVRQGSDMAGNDSTCGIRKG